MHVHSEKLNPVSLTNSIILRDWGHGDFFLRGVLFEQRGYFRRATGVTFFERGAFRAEGVLLTCNVTFF